MHPDSTLLAVLLFVGGASAVLAAVRLRPIALKLCAGLLAVVLPAAGGIAVVNDYYGYYQSWSQLSNDLHGSYPAFAAARARTPQAVAVAAGEVRSVSLAGPVSGINRSGLVYLPPQYFQPAFAHTSFPTLELLHGTPGQPSNWVVQLHLAGVLDSLMSQRQIGPMIVVLPTMSVGSDYQEGVDAPGALDDTYLTRDVRTDVLAQFRASSVPAEWGIGGYSSGGYAAANLALRHPTMFGASGIMDGYFRPTDGPAAAALHNDSRAEAANDPLLLAQNLGFGAHPLPAFWLSAGTADAGDLVAAHAFVQALHGIEQVTLYREPGATHNFDAWRAAIPPLMQWMWTQLAPPALRVQFPVAGAARTAVIKPTPETTSPTSAPTTHAHHSAHHRRAAAAGSGQRSKASTTA